MKEKITAKSKVQGFRRSRLPELTPDEVNLIRGSSDFFGLNHYSSNMVYKNESLIGMYEIPSYNDDINVGRYQPNHWKGGASFWLKVSGLLILSKTIQGNHILQQSRVRFLRFHTDEKNIFVKISKFCINLWLSSFYISFFFPGCPMGVL